MIKAEINAIEYHITGSDAKTLIQICKIMEEELRIDDKKLKKDRRYSDSVYAMIKEFTALILLDRLRKPEGGA